MAHPAQHGFCHSLVARVTYNGVDTLNCRTNNM